ncbi:MAG: ATP cone domain-containing protein, partial [Candidatus Jordarchaeales archaeon]
MPVSKVRKRDGRIVDFDASKIAEAIRKAFVAVGREDGEVAWSLARQVVERLESRFVDSVPGVEDIQDLVEDVLIRNGFSDVAKAYILYRNQRTELREAK